MQRQLGVRWPRRAWWQAALASGAASQRRPSGGRLGRALTSEKHGTHHETALGRCGVTQGVLRAGWRCWEGVPEEARGVGTSEIPSSWSPRCSPNSDHPCDFADVPRDVLVLPPASLRGGLAGSAYGSRDVCFPPATVTVKTFHDAP